MFSKIIDKLKEIFFNIKKYLPKKKRYYVLGAIVLLIVFMSLGGGKGDTENQNEVVTRGDLARTILATGQVKSDISVDLSMTTGGIVQSVPVSVGDKVVKGQTLIALDAGTLIAERASAYASVLLSQAEMKNSEVNLDKIKSEQETLVKSAKSEMLSSGLSAVPSSSSYSVTAPTISGLYSGEEGEYKIIIERKGSNSDYEVRTFNIEKTVNDISEEEPTALGTKGLFISFADSISDYDGTIWYVKIPNTSSSSYITKFNAYQEALRLKEKTIAEAESSLSDRTTSGSVSMAELRKAEAELARVNAELAKYTLRAPYDGTITRVDVKRGELVNAYEPVVVLEDLGKLYIEADVNESNATNVIPGHEVNITYDAFGESVIRKGIVSFVDPSATIVDGIVNYKIKVFFDENEGIKSGMTANLSIQTGFVEDVLQIPSRMTVVQDDKTFVSVVTDEKGKKTSLREVVLGLRGDGGIVEIKSGLSEGEKIKILELE